MLKNKHNILFDQLAPLDIPGPIFDVLKQLYSNYSDRIEKLPKHIVSVYNFTTIIKKCIKSFCDFVYII